MCTRINSFTIKIKKLKLYWILTQQQLWEGMVKFSLVSFVEFFGTRKIAKLFRNLDLIVAVLICVENVTSVAAADFFRCPAPLAEDCFILLAALMCRTPVFQGYIICSIIQQRLEKTVHLTYACLVMSFLCYNGRVIMHETCFLRFFLNEYMSQNSITVVVVVFPCVTGVNMRHCF